MKHKRLDGLIAYVYIDGTHRRQGRDVHWLGPLAAGLHSKSIAADPLGWTGCTGWPEKSQKCHLLARLHEEWALAPP